MAPLGQAWNAETGSGVLDRLRTAYEKRGFSFVAQPQPEMLPPFISPYRPDAIAQKPGENVIIAVKRHQSSSPEQHFGEIRSRIAGHPDWKLNVVYAVEKPEDAIVIPVASLNTLKQRIAEVGALKATNHHRAPFILAWSILEAAVNRLNQPATGHLRSPGQLVQSLAMEGHLGKEAELILRQLANLRNRIVHGDLEANASEEDVGHVLAAINETLVEVPQ